MFKTKIDNKQELKDVFKRIWETKFTVNMEDIRKMFPRDIKNVYLECSFPHGDNTYIGFARVYDDKNDYYGVIPQQMAQWLLQDPFYQTLDWKYLEHQDFYVLKYNENSHYAYVNRYDRYSIKSGTINECLQYIGDNMKHAFPVDEDYSGPVETARQELKKSWTENYKKNIRHWEKLFSHAKGLIMDTHFNHNETESHLGFARIYNVQDNRRVYYGTIPYNFAQFLLTGKIFQKMEFKTICYDEGFEMIYLMDQVTGVVYKDGKIKKGGHIRDCLQHIASQLTPIKLNT